MAIETDPRDQQRTGLVHECLRFKTACEIVTEMTSNPLPLPPPPPACRYEAFVHFFLIRISC